MRKNHHISIFCYLSLFASLFTAVLLQCALFLLHSFASQSNMFWINFVQKDMIFIVMVIYSVRGIQSNVYVWLPRSVQHQQTQPLPENIHILFRRNWFNSSTTYFNFIRKYARYGIWIWKFEINSCATSANTNDGQMGQQSFSICYSK